MNRLEPEIKYRNKIKITLLPPSAGAAILILGPFVCGSSHWDVSFSALAMAGSRQTTKKEICKDRTAGQQSETEVENVGTDDKEDE